MVVIQILNIVESRNTAGRESLVSTRFREKVIPGNIIVRAKGNEVPCWYVLSSGK